MRKIANKSHVPEGKAIAIDLPDGRSIALFNQNGQYYALNNFCPHKGAPLNEGKVENGTVTCPWHCWKFDIKSGECLRGRVGINATLSAGCDAPSAASVSLEIEETMPSSTDTAAGASRSPENAAFIPARPLSPEEARVKSYKLFFDGDSIFIES